MIEPKEKRPSRQAEGAFQIEQHPDSIAAPAHGQEVLDAGVLTVGELANKINEATRAAEGHARGAVHHALEAGRLLIEAKKQVQHGEWEKWLTENCDVAPRTAQAYARLAKKVSELPEAKAQRVADLPLREAIRAIATDPTPPKKLPPIPYNPNAEQRNQSAVKLQAGARALRDASKFVAAGCTVKGQKVASVRKALQDAIDEIDRLVQGGSQ